MRYRTWVMWCVWVREGYEPGGRWMAVESTMAYTRTRAIDGWKAIWSEPAPRGWNWWNMRKRGLVCCVRSVVIPAHEDHLR